MWILSYRNVTRSSRVWRMNVGLDIISVSASVGDLGMFENTLAKHVVLLQLHTQTHTHTLSWSVALSLWKLSLEKRRLNKMCAWHFASHVVILECHWFKWCVSFNFFFPVTTRKLHVQRSSTLHANCWPTMTSLIESENSHLKTLRITTYSL